MSDTFRLPGLPKRSVGLKLLLVCGLALVMTIPALFVFALLMERTQRAEQVTSEIGGLVGGPQTFLGPVLAVPWRIAPLKADDKGQSGTVVLFAATGRADAQTHTQLRRRSLFSVPVYTADVAFSAGFDLAHAADQAPAGAVLDWNRAELLVGASDARGARSEVRLAINGKALSVAPAVLVAESDLQVQARRGPFQGSEAQAKLHLFGAPAASLAPSPSAAPVQVTGALSFNGARRIGVLAFAKTTTVAMRGDWGSPSFDGGFLPVQRRVAGDGGPAIKGFSANWTVPFVARGVAEAGGDEVLGRLGATEMAVSFVEPANPYQSVARSLKYALLFVGLVFLTYFIFETTTGRRVHPAQYVLVGLAQIIFYLLLLSLAERLGFDLGFLIAACATVLLISLYARAVFGGVGRFLLALALFSGLYGLIYVLMRLEDYALLVGAVASFAAIALVMYFTRRIDWYGARQVPASEFEG